MQKIFSTVEAAKYLELSVSALKYHIYISKTIVPRKVGNSYMFTQEQLDSFQSDRRKPGRPRKEPQ